MSAIEQRARELLAQAFGCDEGELSREEVRAARAVIAWQDALTPPEGFVLVPVEPTEAMIEGFWGKIQHGDHERAVAEDAWRDALAARPEVNL